MCHLLDQRGLLFLELHFVICMIIAIDNLRHLLGIRNQGLSEIFYPFISFDLVLCLESERGKFVSLWIDSFKLEILDLALRCLREDDLLFAITFAQVDALADLVSAFLVTVLEVTGLFKIEIALLLAVETTFLHQVALLGDL
jgi:hypothetical protein